MTYTTVIKLDENEKIMEIARLVGGVDITEKAIASAGELVEMSLKLIR
jgi:DNA repair ATPase RecN